MTGDQCAQVVNLLISSFPAGPKGNAWTDAINGLHHGPAQAAARELRDTTDRVSVAQFHAIYRRHLDNARAQRVAQQGAPPVCQQCDGAGWVEAPDHMRHSAACVSPDTCGCHAVVPCRCSTGMARRDVHARIVEANERPA